MSLPMLFLLSLLGCLLATSQPLNKTNGGIYLDHGADGGATTDQSKISGNISTFPIGCFGENRALPSFARRSHINKTNSEIPCFRPASPGDLSSFAAKASEILNEIKFASIADSEPGRALYPMAKAEAGRLVWPTTDNLEFPAPPITTPQLSVLSSQPQQTQTVAPAPPAGELPPPTLLSTHQDSAPSDKAASSSIIPKQHLASAWNINNNPPKVTLPSPPPHLAPLTFGGLAYTANPSSEFILAGQTLKPGGSPITVSGTPISLAADGAAGAIAIIGSSSSSSTQFLTQITPPPSPLTAPPPAVLTFAGSSYTADVSSDFIIDHQTLHPGSAITAQGSTISLAPGAGLAVIGGDSGSNNSTQSLSQASITDALSPSFTPNGTAAAQDSGGVDGSGGESGQGAGGAVENMTNSTDLNLGAGGQPTGVPLTDSFQGGAGGRSDRVDRWYLTFTVTGILLWSV